MSTWETVALFALFVITKSSLSRRDIRNVWYLFVIIAILCGQPSATSSCVSFLSSTIVSFVFSMLVDLVDGRKNYLQRPSDFCSVPFFLMFFFKLANFADNCCSLTYKFLSLHSVNSEYNCLKDSASPAIVSAYGIYWKLTCFSISYHFSVVVCSHTWSHNYNRKWRVVWLLEVWISK